MKYLTKHQAKRIKFEDKTTNVNVEHYSWFEVLRFFAFLSNIITFVFAIVLFARNTWTHEIIFISIASATLLLDLVTIFLWRIILFLNYKDYFRKQGVLFRGRIDSITEKQLKDENSNWVKKYSNITIRFKFKYFFFFRIETSSSSWEGRNIQIIFSAPMKRIDIYFKNHLKGNDKVFAGHARVNLLKEKITAYTDPQDKITKAEFHRFAHASIQNKKQIDEKIKKY